jgi:hypothetical protein
MSLKRIVIVMVVSSACLTSGPPLAADHKGSFDQCMTQANAARKEAAEAGGEWRDVDKLLKEAEKAAGEGDLKLGLKRCKEAELQSQLGYEQAKAPVTVPPAVQAK